MADLILGSTTAITESGGALTIASSTLTTPTIASMANCTFPAGMPIKKSYYAIGRGTYTNASFGLDDTTPQKTEGSEIFSQAYTPSTSSCNLLITTYVRLGESSNIANGMALGLFISDSDDALIVGEDYSMGDTNVHSGNVTLMYQMSSWGTSAKTFSLRASGGDRFNYFSADSSFVVARYSTSACKSALIIEEIAT